MAGTLIVSPGGPFAKFPDGSIAVRASDYVGAARGTLSTAADALASSGFCVIDTQTVTHAEYPAFGFHGDDAEDTVIIPMADVGMVMGTPYTMFASWRIVGDPDLDYVEWERFDSNDAYAWGIGVWGYGSVAETSAMNTQPNIGNRRPCWRIPHYQLDWVKNIPSSTWDETDTINVRLWHVGTDSAEWRLDSLIFISGDRDNTSQQREFYGIWSPSDYDGYLIEETEVTNLDDIGVFSVDYGESEVRRLFFIDQTNDYQKVADLGDAEPCAIDELMFSVFEDNQRLHYTITAGVSHIPDHEVAADIFDRTVGSYVNSDDYWPFDTPYSTLDWGQTAEKYTWINVPHGTGIGIDFALAYVDGSKGIWGQLTTDRAVTNPIPFDYGMAHGFHGTLGPFDFATQGRNLIQMADIDFVISVSWAASSGYTDGLVAQCDVNKVGATFLNSSGSITSTAKVYCAIRREDDGSATARLEVIGGQSRPDNDLNGDTFLIDGPEALPSDPATTTYRIRFQTQLYRIRAKVWVEGDAEPGAWLLDGYLPGVTRPTNVSPDQYDPYPLTLPPGYLMNENCMWFYEKIPYIFADITTEVTSQLEPVDCMWDNMELRYTPGDGDPTDGHVAIRRNVDAGGNTGVLLMDDVTLPYGSQYGVYCGKEQWVENPESGGSDFYNGITVYAWSEIGAHSLQFCFAADGRLLWTPFTPQIYRIVSK